MAKVKITQIKSKIGSTERQRKNLAALGLRRIHHTVEVEVTPITQGMIEKVKHLVRVEE
ncbi:MAG: 50S ribosomal protein L30 [Bacteroidales bacterium]|jgi:large subunit ribosomal protein L30|nr:50S ribosomal protein L30 [Bacteroidales bacterium]MBN2750460.1 50S ribosomal protein L30 [Bacteroidales bacterium]MDX9852255.1 50S ribosomal protein L30 [Tenuifilaceae bacterium]HPX04389.1 50S ribosomal protein L30 [Tenuifilaceae bacterium]HQB77389.1 50S ribosomal protein L30 [Tenuifilaceae bacterium]